MFGIFMRNWDEAEETGNQNCSVEQDLRDAKRVCAALKIPLHEADFVDRYWHQVFTPFLQHYAKGLTPNPDLACNRYDYIWLMHVGGHSNAVARVQIHRCTHTGTR